MVHHKSFQAQGRLFDVLFKHVVEVLPFSFEVVHLTVQEHFSVLYFLLSDESWS